MAGTRQAYIIPLLLGVCAQTTWAGGGVSLGAEYSEGDYGTSETTRSWYFPLGLHYSGGDVTTSLIIPYLTVEGSSQMTFDGRPLAPSGMGGGGAGGGGGTASSTRSVSGLGDVTLSVGYRWLSETQGRPWLGSTVKAKFGTADETKGLGTGENDYTLQIELAKGVWFGFAGYRWLGDTATVNYNDIAFAGVSLNLPLAGKHEWGLEYFIEEASLTGVEEVEEVTLSVMGPLGDKLDYSLYYVSGLSDSSADYALGVVLTKPLGRR